METPRRTLAAMLVLLIGLPAYGKDLALLQLSQFDARTILHSPPANDSTQTKAELARLHAIETERTPAEFDAAVAAAKDETVFLFKPVFGAGFTADKLPETAAFFALAGNDESIFVKIAKDEWKRPRPAAIDPTLHPCTQSKSFSYPSGHATRGYLLGIILGAVVPDRRDAILTQAAAYARDRLVCGVHFRSDIEAGRLTASALAAVMLSQPEVRQRLAAVRAELEAAGFTKAE